MLPSNVREPDIETILFIVVGATICAERDDRPIAHRLKDAIDAHCESADAIDGLRLSPVVCCDLWYLNDGEARLRPTIAIGPPESNAAAAWLATKLPTACLADNAFRIHLDPENLELQACMWGVDAMHTNQAVKLFQERYLSQFVECASLGSMRPQSGK